MASPFVHPPCTRMRLLHKRHVTGLLLCIWAGLLHMYRHGRACWSESYARSASRRPRSVLDRRIGIFAEPNQEQTGQGKGSLIDREDLRIGVETVERAPAQRRSHARADVEQHEHQAINPAVGLEPKITADEKGHEIDFGADAGAAQGRAYQRDGKSPPAAEQRDPEHRQHEEADGDIWTPEPIETPAADDSADDDGDAGDRERAGCDLQLHAAIGEERNDMNDGAVDR